jgi:hypothetical protein
VETIAVPDFVLERQILNLPEVFRQDLIHPRLFIEDGLMQDVPLNHVWDWGDTGTEDRAVRHMIRDVGEELMQVVGVNVFHDFPRSD